MLQAIADRWNLNHPDDRVDTDYSTLLHQPAAKKGPASPTPPPHKGEAPAGPAPEFQEWVLAWVSLLTDGSDAGKERRALAPDATLQRIVFPSSLDAEQRAFVHRQCDGFLSGKTGLGIVSKSTGPSKKVRKVAVTRTSGPRRGCAPLEAQVPEPPALPHKVDLAALANPMPT